MNRIFQQPTLNNIQSILTAHHLPTSDLHSIDLKHFFGCGPESTPQGVIGLQVFGSQALVRSLAVNSEAQGEGCGSALYEKLEQHSKEIGINTLYLLTETAETFFTKRGFKVIDKQDAPEQIKQTKEFSSLCPDSAILMCKTI